jgi:hypothetical protein
MIRSSSASISSSARAEGGIGSSLACWMIVAIAVSPSKTSFPVRSQ